MVRSTTGIASQDGGVVKKKKKEALQAGSKHKGQSWKKYLQWVKG